jgi:CO/xanthine dehydrogenase FAD-binding subunit
MTRLQELVSHPSLPGLLQATALQEGPNTIRNAGTVGGVIVGADPESELLAALLVCDAEVTIETSAGTKTLGLPAFLADIEGALTGGLLTQVSLASGGLTASDRVARTPADRAIVAVVGRKDSQGAVTLAVCGVDETPVLVAPGQFSELSPPGDFRGSSAYRRQMAKVLGQRVADALGAD